MELLHEQLQDSLQELVTSEDWQRALAVATRFHNYSFANTRLIWAQSLAPGFTPSPVAGYRAWQELGRHVQRGERGLQILAPVIRKITPENGEEERRVVGFRVVHIFALANGAANPGSIKAGSDKTEATGIRLPRPGPRVLQRERNNTDSPAGFAQALDRLAAKSDLPRIRLHDLRHTHATVALRANVLLFLVYPRPRLNHHLGQ